MDNSVELHDQNDATLTRGASGTEKSGIHGRYDFECYDSDGNLKWIDYADNLITNQAKNNMMDVYLANGTVSATWYMSLITAGTAIATSTYAVPTVTEITSSIVAARPVVTWTAAASGVKNATTTAFSIIGSATIIGNVLLTASASGSTIGNTGGANGILFSSSSFTGGSKSVSSGDTLNVSYQLTLS